MQSDSVACQSYPEPPDPARRLKAPPAWLITALISAWVAGMITLPILLWTVGEIALPWAVSFNVCLLAAASSLILLRQAFAQQATAWPALRSIGVILLGSWFVEWIGSTTGFPFGHYAYTPVLQPQLAGVPLLIPLAWLMMLPSTWAIGQFIAPANRLAQATAAAGAMTAWDLFLDPQMVAWQVWQWAAPGGYFGIPWVNFLGWFAAAFVLTLAAHPPRLATMPLLLVYTITWLLQTIGLAFFWAMPGPALCGFLGMGLFVVAAWGRYLLAPDRLVAPIRQPKTRSRP